DAYYLALGRNGRQRGHNDERPMTKLIFKIVHAEEWRETERVGSYAGSPKDRADGFMHFSTAPQLAETLRRYYPDPANLLLVAVDEAALGPALKYEHTPSRGENFPHLYDALPLSSVKWTATLGRDPDGQWILPGLG